MKRIFIFRNNNMPLQLQNTGKRGFLINKTSTMKASMVVVMVFIAMSLLFSCKKDSPGKVQKVVFTKTQVEVLNSSNQFGFNLLRDLSDSGRTTNNLFISPLSISMALTMTYNGAVGQTALDMQQTLGYGSLPKATINESSKELMNNILNLDPNVTMDIANSIWYKNTFTVNQDFLNLNKTYFNAEVYPTDFSNPQTVSLINSWVSSATNGTITSVITEIPANLVMYLINAIYFKGDWKYRFETKNTAQATFYPTNGNSFQTDFMNMKQTFRYMKNDLFSAVELPYGNGGFSMMILLPDQGKSCQDIISNLTPDHWAQWNQQLDSTEVLVNLPKFRFSYGKELSSNLKNLGMGIAFDSQQADFSGISTSAHLCISFVLHKGYVNVDEDGTEAAAVTVVGIITTATSTGPDYEVFNANKPFVFAIKENTTNSVIFIGLVMKPVVEAD